jgi:endonuclease III
MVDEWNRSVGRWLIGSDRGKAKCLEEIASQLRQQVPRGVDQNQTWFFALEGQGHVLSHGTV